MSSTASSRNGFAHRPCPQAVDHHEAADADTPPEIRARGLGGLVRRDLLCLGWTERGRRGLASDVLQIHGNQEPATFVVPLMGVLFRVVVAEKMGIFES